MSSRQYSHGPWALWAADPNSVLQVGLWRGGVSFLGDPACLMLPRAAGVVWIVRHDSHQNPAGVNWVYALSHEILHTAFMRIGEWDAAVRLDALEWEGHILFPWIGKGFPQSREALSRGLSKPP